MPEDKKVFGIIFGFILTPQQEPVSIPVRMFPEESLGKLTFGDRVNTVLQALEMDLEDRFPGSEWVVLSAVGTHKEALKSAMAQGVNGTVHTMIEIMVEEPQ